MGIVVRKNHGTEYLYFLVGKSQLFLGKKADLEGLNQQNLEQGIHMADATFDKTFTKYLESMQKQAKYLPPEKRRKYVKKRLQNIDVILAAFDKTK